MKPMEIVFPKTKEEAPHEEVPYFFATKDGWFKNLPTLFGVAQVEAEDGPPHLEEWKPTYMLNDTKLPAWVLSQAHDFFRHIWNEMKTESSVYILYNRKDSEFKLFAPEQYVTGVAVNHKLDRSKLPNGFTPVGTIHSHCNFSAFHSGTDRHDAAQMPGLHITIGHVDRDEPEMVFGLSVGDQTFDVERKDIVNEDLIVNRHGYNTMPPYWPMFVKRGTAPWGSTGTTIKYASTPTGGGWRKPTQRSIHTNSNYTYPGAPWSKSTSMVHRWDQQAWGFDDDWEQQALLPEISTDPRKVRVDEEEDPFNKYEDVVETACGEIDDLIHWLNTWGFHVSYSVSHSPAAAKAQKNAFEERERQDGAPTP